MAIYTCKDCGKEANRKKSKVGDKAYRCRQCYLKSRTRKPHKVYDYTQNKTCRDCKKAISNGATLCPSCAKKASRTRVQLACDICGQLFERSPSGIKDKNYCSRKCGDLARRVPGGDISVAGYRIIRIDGKQVYEHRYVMEQHLDRPLTSDEVIHHINHDKLDNRIENLELTTQQKHTPIHHAGKKVSESTKAKTSKALQGHTFSQETRSKISESLKRYYANRHQATVS